MAAALLLALPAAAEQIRLLSTPAGPMRLSLPVAPAAEPHPLVIILPDRPAADLRAEPYIERLLQAGIAVLEVGLDDAEEASAILTRAGLHAALAEIAPHQPDETRIGFLGFGAGGRAVLDAPPDMPAAALYPSCPGLLPRPRIAATLLLHPDNPAEATACRLVTPHAQPIRGATHGWDHRQGAWQDGTALLPHPDGSGKRIRAQGNGWATDDAAERVLRHFRPLTEAPAP
jgi:hypothetical protein